MAKKINTEEQVSETPVQNNPNSETKEKTTQVADTSIEAPAHVKDILKGFTGYKTLFVDKHGGVFTPDTALVIRGDATLYENPFYNPEKN
ncbi:hypothetical protein [Bacteroides sp. 51]|uniref:hypothetical protein n=1 Tax=Bacteroides sp. 51 TaxID=2302938 RepID=UPI0013D27A13|nr:hypothetical protein [Bacteroides sp. 51]NDV80820.1 hypothetical protein [Bacteroides sp. 51]